MSLSPVKRAQPAAPPSQRSYFDKFRDHVPPTPASSSRPSPNKDVLAPEPRVVAPCTRIGRDMHPSLAKNRGSGCGVTDPIIVSDTEDKDDISEFNNSLQSSGREQQVSKGQTFRERTVDRSPRRHIREGGHQGGNTSPPSNTSAARPRTESPVKRSYHSGHGLTSSSQAAVPWAAVGVIDQIKGSARRSSKTHTSPSRREKSMIDSVTDAVPIRSDPRRTTVAKDLHSARPPGTSWPGRAPPYRPRQSEPGPSVITTFKNVAVAMHEPRRRGAETAAVYPEAPIDLCSTSGSSTASRISSISIPTPRALSHLSPTKIRSSAFGSHAKKLKPATPVTEVETSPFPLIDIATPLASPISKKNVLLRPSKLETTDDGVPREGVGSSVSTASHESTSQMSGPFASAATAPESATDTQPSSTPRVRQPFPLSVRARELASPSKPSADAMHLQAKIGEAFLVRPSLDTLTACPTKVTSTQQHSTVDLDTQYPPRSRLTHAEANLTRRPSRVRPEPGKYTLLPVDTPIHLWTTKDSSHATDKRRLSGKETSAAFARAETETLLAPKVTAMDPSYGVELSAQRSETLTRGPSTRSSTLTSLSTSASPQKVILVMEPMMQDKPEVQVVEEQEEAEEIVEQTPSTESADVVSVSLLASCQLISL